MKKAFLIIVLSLFLPVSLASASSNVNIVVLGMINHGPMQPTVNAIKEVTSKYPDANVTWLDLETQEGQDYAQEHDLSAHLNILVDGRYQYNVNGKEVTFQWFEGQEWTKGDLDAVISGILDNDSALSPVDAPKSNTGNIVIIFVVILAIVGLIAWFLAKKLRK